MDGIAAADGPNAATPYMWQECDACALHWAAVKEEE